MAPQHASLASSIKTFCTLSCVPLSLSPWASWSRLQAAKAPTIPLPTTTTSTAEGRSLVVRWLRRIFDGSLCQYDAVDAGVGRGAQPSCSVCVIISCFGESTEKGWFWESVDEMFMLHTVALVRFRSRDECTVAVNADGPPPVPVSRPGSWSNLRGYLIW